MRRSRFAVSRSGHRPLPYSMPVADQLLFEHIVEHEEPLRIELLVCVRRQVLSEAREGNGQSGGAREARSGRRVVAVGVGSGRRRCCVPVRAEEVEEVHGEWEK